MEKSLDELFKEVKYFMKYNVNFLEKTFTIYGVPLRTIVYEDSNGKHKQPIDMISVPALMKEYTEEKVREFFSRKNVIQKMLENTYKEMYDSRIKNFRKYENPFRNFRLWRRKRKGEKGLKFLLEKIEEAKAGKTIEIRFLPYSLNKIDYKSWEQAQETPREFLKGN